MLAASGGTLGAETLGPSRWLHEKLQGLAGILTLETRPAVEH